MAASVPVTTGQTTATFTVTTSSVTGTTPVDILATYNSVTVHAVLTLTSYAVENKAPVEPRWAELGGPVLTASLAPWREMGFSSGTYSAGVVRLRFVEELEDGEQGLQGVRSFDAASVPGPPKRNYLYSPEMSLLAESEMSTPRDQKVLYEYVWFNGHPVAQIDGQTVTHWTFTDHLGTPIIQTTASPAVWWRAEYEPYGRVWAYNPTGLADQHQPLRLPGQEAEQFNLGMNGATERSYNVFRWYRGGWGRYTQSDPAWSAYRLDELSNYLYAINNPVDLTDPLGLSGETSIEYWDCVAKCIEKYKFSNVYTLIGSSANAAGNSLVGDTGRTGIGGVPPHPTTWENKIGSEIARKCRPAFPKAARLVSRGGRFAGRAAIVLTVFEGFYDIGTIGRCMTVCGPVKDRCCP